MPVVDRWTGAEARLLREVALRLSLRDFADRLGIPARTISKWEQAGATRVPRPHMQAILDTALQQADSSARARFMNAVGTGPGRHEPTVADVVRARPSGRASGYQVLTAEEMIANEVAETARSAAIISSGSVSDSALEYVDLEVRRLATGYATMSPSVLFGELAEVRRSVFVLLDRNRFPGQMHYLQVQAARITGLCAHALLDRGDYHWAERMTNAAWVCAEAAGHPETLGWIRGVQSLIAFWGGDNARAAGLAADGTARTDSTITRVRLAGLAARAHGRMGNTAAVLEAIRGAERAREQVDSGPPPDGLPGLFAFPEHKVAGYASTALLSLGDTAHLGLAVEQSNRAITLNLQANEGRIVGPDILAAYLDLATAYLLEGELDGAAEAIGHVGGAPAAYRSASIRQRADAFIPLLGSPRLAGSNTAAELRDVLETVAAPLDEPKRLEGTL